MVGKEAVVASEQPSHDVRCLSHVQGGSADSGFLYLDCWGQSTFTLLAAHIASIQRSSVLQEQILYKLRFILKHRASKCVR